MCFSSIRPNRGRSTKVLEREGEERAFLAPDVSDRVPHIAPVDGARRLSTAANELFFNACRMRFPKLVMFCFLAVATIAYDPIVCTAPPSPNSPTVAAPPPRATY